MESLSQLGAAFYAAMIAPPPNPLMGNMPSAPWIKETALRWTKIFLDRFLSSGKMKANAQDLLLAHHVDQQPLKTLAMRFHLKTNVLATAPAANPHKDQELHGVFPNENAAKS